MIGVKRETDFERFALAGSAVEAAKRSLLLTIDFEAFNHKGSFELWLVALERWADHAREKMWGFSVFLALEDVVQLRHSHPAYYQEFLEGMRTLHRTGAEFYPHNHGIFDSRTGNQAEHRPQHVVDYGKRASFFYDVVRRHRVNLRAWLDELLCHYGQFLQDAGIEQPERLAFRAGGWDYGATREENRAYIDAVSDAGFAFDSSATAGTFGTKDFRIGAPFRRNTFQLKEGLIEVAPCWSYDCGAERLSLEAIGPILHLLGQPRLWTRRQRPGAFVAVLHFDHLFRPLFHNEGRLSASTVKRRVDRFFTMMARLKRVLHFSEAITFERLKLGEIDD
jgi:hypothetical protein